MSRLTLIFIFSIFIFVCMECSAYKKYSYSNGPSYRSGQIQTRVSPYSSYKRAYLTSGVKSPYYYKGYHASAIQHPMIPLKYQQNPAALRDQFSC